MKTKPITGVPNEEMIGFNGVLLVVFGPIIKRRDRELRAFRVYNGNWSGLYDHNRSLIHVDQTSKTFEDVEPFREVVHMSGDEQRRWYYDGLNYVRELFDEDVEMISELEKDDDGIPF